MSKIKKPLSSLIMFSAWGKVILNEGLQHHERKRKKKMKRQISELPLLLLWTPLLRYLFLRSCHVYWSPEPYCWSERKSYTNIIFYMPLQLYYIFAPSHSPCKYIYPAEWEEKQFSPHQDTFIIRVAASALPLLLLLCAPQADRPWKFFFLLANTNVPHIPAAHLSCPTPSWMHAWKDFFVVDLFIYKDITSLVSIYEEGKCSKMEQWIEERRQFIRRTKHCSKSYFLQSVFVLLL